MDVLHKFDAEAGERVACASRSPQVHPILLGAAAFFLVGASAAAAWFVRERWSQPAPSNENAPPPALVKGPDVQRGRLLYQANCQACHGPEGHGDGVSADMKPPLPRDFAAASWKFGATPVAVRRVLRDGSPGTAMPSFALLPEGERADLAAFILSLAPEEARETPRLPAELAERLSGAGFAPQSNATFAPDLSLTDLDGRAFSLQQCRGKVVLLNFWGTTCVNCLRELPDLEKLARDVGSDFAVVSVCFDETNVAEVRRLIRGRVHDMPVYVNPDGRARARYDVQVMPSLFLLDPAGRLVGHATGARAWSATEIRDLIRVMKE